MQQSGVGKHHGRARGDATAVRRHRSARRLALPAYPSDSCFDSHLAPSERSLVSSESTTYIVRCSPQTSSWHHQGTWEAELWVEAGIWPAQRVPAEDQGFLAVTSEHVCLTRSSARKNPVSPLVLRFQFSRGTRLGQAPLRRAKPKCTASRYSTRWAVFNPAYSESPKGPRSLGKWQDARGVACNGS